MVVSRTTLVAIAGSMVLPESLFSFIDGLTFKKISTCRLLHRNCLSPIRALVLAAPCYLQSVCHMVPLSALLLYSLLLYDHLR